MRTSYRDIFLLACCQALLLTNGAGLITMNGLVGYALADTKALATLGVTLYVLGSAVATMPASLVMARIGRRKGFMAGALINVAGCALAALAISRGSFVLYCIATAVIGVYNAIGLQYRFAAAEVAAPADKAKAISLVLAGGVVGGFLGPESARRAVDLFATPFLGGFVVLAGYALLALVVQSFVHVPPPTLEERSGKGRPLSVIVRQPVFIVAVLAGAVGYGLMNLLMTATPIAMDLCSHPFGAVAIVIEWHVVGMFAPGFFTGSLIRRFGVLNVILAGIVLVALCVAIALNGVTVAHFLRGARAARHRLELHVHRRHDIADRVLCAGGKGARAGRERLHRVRDDGRVVTRLGRDGVHRRLGSDEPRGAATARRRSPRP